MKTLLTAFILITGINVIAQTKLKTDSVYISGKVAHYERYKDSANSVQFIINDLASGGQLTYRAKINSNAQYKVVFIKTGPQDIMMQYNNDLTDIIVSPGNHMQIDFDAGNFEKSLSFKGDDAQTNKDMFAYNDAVDKANDTLYKGDKYARFKELSKSQKEDNPNDHKNFLAARYSREKQFLDRYVKTHTLSPTLYDNKKIALTKTIRQQLLSPTFVKWANADIKYEYFENLMRYTWLHPMYNKTKEAEFKIPDNYYDFANLATLNKASLAITSHFGSFLQEYNRYFLRKNLGSSWPVGKDYQLFLKQPPGIVKDVMLSNAFFTSIKAKNLNVIKPYLSSFETTVSTPGFKKDVLYAYSDAESKLKNYTLPLNAQINITPKTEADSVLNKILAKYPDKVVYVDFWATWCGPCREEMPNAKKLRKDYQDKDIVFVFLGIQSEEKTWKALIAELDIQGEHYLLTNNDFSAMAAKFQVSGIPHYLLISKNGQVIDDNAKRPGDILLKKDINALLAVQ